MRRGTIRIIVIIIIIIISNAFNSIHRRKMLLAVHSRMPALYSYCSSAYNQPSVLFSVHTLCSLKRVPNKVTLLGHFYSAILFTHCCHLYSPNLTLVFWTMSLWVVTLTWWLLMLQRSYGLAQK